MSNREEGTDTTGEIEVVTLGIVEYGATYTVTASEVETALEDIRTAVLAGDECTFTVKVHTMARDVFETLPDFGGF